jgi:TolA-binding protein
MAKTTTEKIENLQGQIQQLENQRKRLLQQQKEQERKDRTRRLCKRAGLLESLLPETITLTDEQFKTFLEKTLLGDYAIRVLGGLKMQQSGAPVN